MEAQERVNPYRTPPADSKCGRPLEHAAAAEKKVKHAVAAVASNAQETNQTAAPGAQADEARAANNDEPVCKRRCPDDDRIGDPTEPPPRPLPREADRFRQHTVPL